jgi:hypothetical protein
MMMMVMVMMMMVMVHGFEAPHQQLPIFGVVRELCFLKMRMFDHNVPNWRTGIQYIVAPPF